jgi:hypothetical protein
MILFFPLQTVVSANLAVSTLLPETHTQQQNNPHNNRNQIGDLVSVPQACLLRTWTGRAALLRRARIAPARRRPPAACRRPSPAVLAS